ncbi:MAG: hypothetical protein IPJ43_15965 [Saprospiraceae bacterium]|nr:hypothetical protein [Saprospiraceae bacterium]
MSSEYQFLRPYLRGWFFILTAMVISYFIAEKYLSYNTPIYQSTAKLRLADLNEGVPNSKLFKDLDVFANTQKIQSEIELIKSEAILKRVLPKIAFSMTISRIGKIKNTELFSDSPLSIEKLSLEEHHYNKSFILSVEANKTFTLLSPEGAFVNGHLGDSVSFGSTRLFINLNQTALAKKTDLKWIDKYELRFLNEEMQYTEILKNLEVNSVEKDVPVIRISYKSNHPEKSAMLPNMLAEAYIEDYVETKYGAANVTVEFLDERIKEMSQKLSCAEEAILNYRIENNITNIRQETETDLRKVSQLKIQQTNLKMNLDAIKDLESYMEKGKENFLELAPNFEAFTDLLSTEMIKKIKQLQSEKKDLLLEYTPTSEKVKVIDAKIEDITSYLAESIRNTRKNLQSKYDNLIYDIDESEKVFLPVPEEERMMNILQREFEIYQESYNFLNQKRIEAEIARAAKTAFHRIITPASISKVPVSPNYIIIKAISVLLGMLCALFIIFIVHRLRARINQISTIEATSIVPIAAAIPKLKTDQEKENFFVRMLTQWQVKDLLQKNNISCYTGFHKDHGLSFATRNIIHTLTNQGKNILIVQFKNGTATNSFYDLHEDDSNQCRMILWSESLKLYSTETIQNVIREKSKSYDHTIIINSLFGDNFTLAFMAIANVNYVCVDTRITAAKRLSEIDLIATEYKLPRMHYIVNRVAYQPSIWKQISSYFKRRAALNEMQTQYA